MSLGTDHTGRPIHLGDEVVYVLEDDRTQQRRRVLGLVSGHQLYRDEGGYFKVSDTRDLRGYHCKFGCNLIVLYDPDFEVDEGL